MNSEGQSREQMEYEKVIQDAEMRKIFPILEEQMENLAPELQVELYNMEERYDREIHTARMIRKEILNATNDLFEANITCGKMVRAAQKTRNDKIKELRNKWGKFFYDNPKQKGTHSAQFYAFKKENKNLDYKLTYKLT